MYYDFKSTGVCVDDKTGRMLSDQEAAASFRGETLGFWSVVSLIK